MARQGWDTAGRDGPPPQAPLHRRGESPRDPAPLRALLGDVRFAPLWLLLRLAVGWLWLQVGWGQLPMPRSGLAASGRDLSDLLAVALTLLGIALLLGGLTGVAAFAGGCLSAGLWGGESLTFAALHFAAVVWLILAWKTAGWIGLDRWLLPALGMPWRGSALFAGSFNGIYWKRRIQRERSDAG